jgi:hypothetical protein
MSVLMADSTRPWLIPATFKYAAAYENGLYAWTAEQTDRFDGHTRIGVLAGDQEEQARTCRILDVERGDATYADAPVFLAERRAAGHVDGTIYCSRSLIPLVHAACQLKGVEVPRWWVADWTGKPHECVVPTGVCWAVQYEHLAGYDVSVVWGPLGWARS